MPWPAGRSSPSLRRRRAGPPFRRRVTFPRDSLRRPAVRERPAACAAARRPMVRGAGRRPVRADRAEGRVPRICPAPAARGRDHGGGMPEPQRLDTCEPGGTGRATPGAGMDPWRVVPQRLELLPEYDDTVFRTGSGSPSSTGSGPRDSCSCPTPSRTAACSTWWPRCAGCARRSPRSAGPGQVSVPVIRRAMAIGALLAMPSARGLFSRAICPAGRLDRQTAGQATRVTRQLVAVADLPATRAALNQLTPAELTEVTGRTIAQAENAASRPADPRLAAVALRQQPFGPVVDGEILPRDPLAAAADGAEADVPVLLATTRDEARQSGPAGCDRAGRRRRSRGRGDRLSGQPRGSAATGPAARANRPRTSWQRRGDRRFWSRRASPRPGSRTAAPPGWCPSTPSGSGQRRAAVTRPAAVRVRHHRGPAPRWPARRRPCRRRRSPRRLGRLRPSGDRAGPATT